MFDEWNKKKQTTSGRPKTKNWWLMLSFINFQEHPTNQNKKVFFFKNEKHSEVFEALLKENLIVFEKQIDHEGDKTIYFGVKKADFELAKKLNFITIGKFRKRFIPDKTFRILILGLSILLIALAIIGAFVSG